MMKLKVKFAKNKCLSTIWSTEKIPATEHYKNANYAPNFEKVDGAYIVLERG